MPRDQQMQRLQGNTELHMSNETSVAVLKEEVVVITRLGERGPEAGS